MHQGMSGVWLQRLHDIRNAWHKNVCVMNCTAILSLTITAQSFFVASFSLG